MKLKNWMIGCGIGCGALVLIAVSSCVGFAVWINRPGELIETERLLGPSTTGYVEWTLRLEDPGTEAFVERGIQWFSDLQRQQNQQLPGWVQGFQNLQSRRDKAQIRALFPLAAVWTLEPGREPGTDSQQISLSLKQLGNRIRFMDWMFGLMMGRNPSTRVHRYADEKIYEMDMPRGTTVTLFVRGNDVFFCADLDGAKLAVDRLRGDAAESDGTGLARLLAEATPERPLRGAIVNDGQLGRLLGELPDADWDDVRGVTVAGGLQADDSFVARIEVLGPDGTWAAAHAEALSDFARQKLSAIGANVTGRARGDRVLLDVVVADILQTAEEKIEAAGGLPE